MVTFVICKVFFKSKVLSFTNNVPLRKLTMVLLSYYYTKSVVTMFFTGILNLDIHSYTTNYHKIVHPKKFRPYISYLG